MSKSEEISNALKDLLLSKSRNKEKVFFDLKSEKSDEVVGRLELVSGKPTEIIIPEFPEKIEIKNYKELAKEVGKESKMVFPDFPTSFEIANLDQIQFPNRFEIINFPSVQQVEVINQQESPAQFDISLDQYTKPTKPLAVRFSDGKYFQELANLIGEKIVVAGGGGGGKEILAKEINHGNLTTASGVATSLSESSVFCRTVTVQSHPENQGYIYIGKNTVTPISYGGILQPGEPKDIEIDDVSRIFVSADYNNEKVSWMIVR